MNPETTRELTRLRMLRDLYPDIDSAVAAAATLRAKLTLPKGVIHVISDVHGDYKKLRHVVNNASGALRPLVESVFADRLDERALRELLAVLYYPQETMSHLLGDDAPEETRREWVMNTLRHQFAVVRRLARNYPRGEVFAKVADNHRVLFEELLAEPITGRPPEYVAEMVAELVRWELDREAVRAASRLVRNLAVSEILVAGDLGDRGPRIDRVIGFLRQQPRVSLVWGNHDVTWMGATLGHPPCIATVMRLSLRYQRLWQLEEGYGITLSPLERLVDEIYADDPAERFLPHHGSGLRDARRVARMQKAMAIMEFKLTGQLIEQHPEWGMDDRNLLPLIDPARGVIRLGGTDHALLDPHLPTLDPAHPNRLSVPEQNCLERLQESFTGSPRLWEHMKYVVRHGSMAAVRDHAAVFHACVPVDPEGNMLELEVDGRSVSGRAMFGAFDLVIHRAYRKTAARRDEDADWFWYLWAGPRSPLFGKDRMTTFERYFVADKETHRETRNPYFTLQHDTGFCDRIGRELGLAGDVLLVNGHVPVKVEDGETPLKKGGNAITIDGAFSESYGDRGYTLVLGMDRVDLAEHHHFESVEEAIRRDADIMPTVTTIRRYERRRLVADTEEGLRIRARLEELERLIEAFREGGLWEVG